MPRPNSQPPTSSASAYYSPDPMSPTFSPPGEYTEFQTLRPGTPGSFGRYSVTSSNFEKYDRDGAATPQAQGLLASGERSSTYYFNKEGGAAAGATGAASGFHQYQGRRGQGYNPANNAALEGGYKTAKRPNFIRRRPILFSVLVLLVLIAAGVGAGVGISQSNKSSNKNLSAQNSSSGSHSGASPSGSASAASPSSSSSSSSDAGSNRGSSTPAAPKITPFPRWSWTDTNTKAFGVSLGSWLVLERWQLEDWMVQQGGPNSWDEFRFTQNLGTRAASVLQDHQNTWVTEADMDSLQNAGVNLIRIPIPFWAFIPTVSGEPYVTTGYVDQLNKMLEWCYNRNMYVMLDLHAMPGSQNGDQSSGHNTTDIEWYTQANQARSDAFLKNVLDWATTSNYSSIINSIGPVNEPRIVDDNWALDQNRFQIAQAYYERSYATCLKYNMPMLFHNGFAPGTVQDKMNLWKPFVTGKDPNMLIYEDHPYPGWFQTPEPGADAIQTSVCEYGAASNSFGVPIVMGEFSAINNLNSTSYSRTYLQMQLATYGWSAGSVFWNFKANKSQTKVLALADNLMELYSFLDMMGDGYMPNPGKGGNVRNFYAGLPNPCGGFQTFGWNNPVQ